jgi:hypothetical protein
MNQAHAYASGARRELPANFHSQSMALGLSAVISNLDTDRTLNVGTIGHAFETLGASGRLI